MLKLLLDHQSFLAFVSEYEIEVPGHQQNQDRRAVCIEFRVFLCSFLHNPVNRQEKKERGE